MSAPEQADALSERLHEDSRRIAAVRRVLTAGLPPHSLDRLTRLAAELLGTTYAQVSLLAEEQIIASIHGLEIALADRASAATDSLCSLTVEAGAAVAVTDTHAHPRTAALPQVTGGLVRSYLGVPLRDSAGLILGALCVYDGVERAWSAGDVGVLGELAASVVAELELRALAADMTRSSAQLELALGAADIGSFDYDLVSGALQWDDRLVALFGYDRSTFGEHWASFEARVHPEDLPRVREAVDRAVESIGDFSADYRIVVPGTGDRWVQARGRVLPDMLGRPSRLLGAAFDVTELRSTRDRLARLLETMSDAFMALDHEWRFSYVNPEAERLLARRREDLLGRSIWAEFPEALGGTFQERYEHAARTGETVLFEEFFAPLDRWFEVRAWPGPDGLSVYFHDITERRRAEGERQAVVLEREQAYAAAEAANTRLAMLADASTRLSASLEPADVLRTLAGLVVPQLGAWVVVALVAETAAPLLGRDEVADPMRLQVVEVAHPDPVVCGDLRELLSSLPLSLDDPVGVGAVTRTGEPEWLAEVPDEALASVAPDELLLDLAGRAGAALDNALLYGTERRTGITLQRSLLPRELPDVPGLLLAPRYLPGATGAFVGGDWYQGVPVGDGVLLAMGDVMGHGMRSAARMGQLRAIVATLALEGHMPGELLTRLAASSDVLLDLELATLLVAHYDVPTRTMTVASAGHPPPLLTVPGVEPSYVDVVPGPPIGTFPGTYPEATVRIEPGATLVLYTDGLVESRDAPLDDGLERLRVCLRNVDLPPEDVCTHVLRALGRLAGGEDDVALLVMAAIA
ncbi:MAG: SpoIIE family protein phosphatase [Actinobacteria bacterium]|nr:SpoIIE family protein phosphatase [Actinomycetota bacterium]